MKKRMLLISNSTNFGEEYLAWPRTDIQNFLGNNIKEILFIPFAGVTLNWDAYGKRVDGVFKELGYKVNNIYDCKRMIEAVVKAQAIVVGGGNTFSLLYHMQRYGLIEAVREAVINGTPFIGWSAGSNLACPTIKTTNDMPVIEPFSFNALNLIPFQINPHYTDAMPPNHGGETREQRLMEFLAANKNIYVAGLKEATMLRIEDQQMQLLGKHGMRLFHYGQDIQEIEPNANVDFLLR